MHIQYVLNIKWGDLYWFMNNKIEIRSNQLQNIVHLDRN